MGRRTVNNCCIVVPWNPLSSLTEPTIEYDWCLSKLSKLAKINLLDVINLCFCSSSLHLLVINRRKESFETPAPNLAFKENMWMKN